jgi:hypothetical protein
MTFASNLPTLSLAELKRLKDTNVDREDTVVVSAHSPVNRAGQVNDTVTFFAAIQNGGSVPATWCGLSPLSPDLQPVPIQVNYSETDEKNMAIGPPNPLVTLDPGQVKTFVVAFQALAPVSFQRFRLVHDCWETAPAMRVTGLNDFGFVATADPIPDILLIGITMGNTNIVDLPGDTGTSAFAVAGLNLGATSEITLAAGPLNPSTPVKAPICETNITTGQCLHDPVPTLTLQWTSGQDRAFAVFPMGLGNVPTDLANNRIGITATDPQGNEVGGWNAAIRTIPAP